MLLHACQDDGFCTIQACEHFQAHAFMQAHAVIQANNVFQAHSSIQNKPCDPGFPFPRTVVPQSQQCLYRFSSTDQLSASSPCQSGSRLTNISKGGTPEKVLPVVGGWPLLLDPKLGLWDPARPALFSGDGRVPEVCKEASLVGPDSQLPDIIIAAS